MTISYPLSLPDIKSPRKLTWYCNTDNAVSISPPTGQTQIQRSGSDGWALDISLPNLSRDDAAEWWSFLASLRGQFGTFMAGDPIASTPRGVATGTPVTGVAAPGDDELEIKGMTPSTGNIWRAGDYIQVGVRLYMILGSHTSNGSGSNTVPVFPTIREAIADSTAIITTNPKGLFRLTDPTVTWGVDERKTYDISFSAIEAR